MRERIVYVFTNEGLPGARKIGRTVRGADRRAAEVTKAYGTCFPFVVESKHVVNDPTAVEALTHRLLRKHRVRNTEIFYVSAKVASSTIKTAAMMTLHRPLWKRVWHWVVLPRGRAASAPRRTYDGHYAVMIMLLALAIAVFVAVTKPDLPDWLPGPVLRTATFIESRL